MRPERSLFRSLIPAALALAACTLLPACRHIPAADQTRAAPADAARDDEAYRQIERLAETMLLIKKYYVEDRDYTNILSGALGGMLQALDEHSHYMDAAQVKDLQEGTTGKYGGIGIYIGTRDGLLTVIAPIEDTPAYRAGMLSRDIITAIDGVSTVTLSEQEAVKRLRGDPGTKVVVTIQRKDEAQPRTFELVREKINVTTVKGARMVRPGIGYVRITQFSEPTADALQEALDKLAGEGMKALVLDLRSNPGGLLKSAQQVAGKFLEKDALVVSVRDRSGKPNEKKLLAEGTRHNADMPLAILINGGSASASEIVAGALQDHRRAFLVGEKSFGKGSVQTVIPLSTAPDSAIRLTTAKYYTPSERVIHKNGIEPDIRVPVTPEEWQNILIHRAHLETPDNFLAEEKKKYADVADPPLDRAADVLHAMIILDGRIERPAAATGSVAGAGSTPDEESAPDDE